MLNPIKVRHKKYILHSQNPFKIPEQTTEIGVTVQICIIYIVWNIHSPKWLVLQTVHFPHILARAIHFSVTQIICAHRERLFKKKFCQGSLPWKFIPGTTHM
jgi:hypothetical protein